MCKYDEAALCQPTSSEKTLPPGGVQRLEDIAGAGRWASWANPPGTVSCDPSGSDIAARWKGRTDERVLHRASGAG